MNATELKYGDVVYCTNPVTKEAKVVEVEFVHSEKLVKITQGYRELIGTLSPVPLTGEILKKNGWESIYDGYSYDEHIILKTDDDVVYGVYIESEPCGINISSVHELQHILWALGLDDDLKI